MISPFRSCALVLLLVLSSAVTLPAKTPNHVPISKQKGYAQLNPKRLGAHLRFLSHDLLEGRETTERGQKLAATYIASTFQRIGLEPLGDSLLYFQPFSVQTHLIKHPPSISLISSTENFTLYENTDFLTDFFFFPTHLNGLDTLLGDLVVLGHKTNILPDNFNELELRGKIVLSFSAPPPNDNTSDTATFNLKKFWRETRLHQSAAGLNDAKAVLIVRDALPHTTLSDLGLSFKEKIYTKPMKLSERMDINDRNASLSTFYVSTELANQIIKPLNTTIHALQTHITKTGKVVKASLPSTKLRISTGLTQETRRTENVLGLLKGSDPKLNQEVIVLSAHYDHIGISQENEVYNGADDNGSGTSAVLSIAEAMVQNPNRPKRSVVFCCFTGEEKGLLGSKYYALHPKFSPDKTIAAVNLDMIGRVDTKYLHRGNSHYIYVIGPDSLSHELDQILKKVNQETVNLTLDYSFNDLADPNRYYYRSDHYHFAKKGIPSVFLFNGLHKDYHQTSDTFEKIDAQSLTARSKLVYGFLWKLANLSHSLRRMAKPH